MMKKGSIRSFAAAGLLAVAMIVSTGGAALAAEETTCSFDRRAKTVALDIGRAGSANVYVWKGTIEIAASGFNGQCGKATVRNTDSILVTGTHEFSEFLTIDLRNGPLAPGSAKESDTKEIEIAVNLGGTEGFFSEDIVIQGGPDDEVFAIGQAGISLNGDSDVDLTYVKNLNEPRIKLAGGGGGDTITGQGGFGSGAPYFSAYYPLEIYGGECCIVGAIDPDGADTLTGSDSDDIIRGGTFVGNTISGLGGDDAIFGSWFEDVITGGEGNDQLNGDNGADQMDGGPGNDSLTGGGEDDVLRGGPGFDWLDGDAGLDVMFGDGDDDFIDSDDNQADQVDGGDGEDTADVDSYDTVTGVEQLR